MAVVEVNWNGTQVIGERLKIRNIIDNTTIRIKHLFLNNTNNYLLSNTSNLLPQGFVFYHEYFAFKFFNAPIATQGVVIEDLDTFEAIPNLVFKEINPGFFTFNGFANPFSVRYFPAGQPLYQVQYVSGPGITVVDATFLNEGTVKLFNYNLRDLYRAPKVYNLPAYSENNDELEIFVIFTPNVTFRGEYEAELTIKYNDGFMDKVHTNTIKCNVQNSNFSEVDKTLEQNIFSIEGVQLEGNTINLF